MSKGKKLAVFAGVLVLLIAACLVIAVLQKNGVMPGGDSSEESSSTISTNSEYLLQRDKTEIASIDVKNEGAEYTLVSKLTQSQDSSGNEKTEQSWYLKDHEDWELTSSVINSLSSVGSALMQVSTVAENKAEVQLANYGLSKPYAEMTVHYTDGTSVTVKVGDTTPDGSYRYAVLSDHDGVYTVYKSVATYAAYDLTNLRSITIEQINVEEELTYLLLEEKDGRPIEIRTWEDGETHDEIYDTSPYKMLSPYGDWPWTVVTGNLSDYFSSYESVSIEKLVEADAADLDKYGLGDTSFEHHVKVTTRVQDTSSENSGSDTVKYEYHTADYYFGISAGDGLIYFRQGGSNDVYTVKESSLDCFDFEPFDYIQKIIFLYDIQKMDSYSVTGNGQTYECSILRQDESEVSSTDESSAERLAVYYLNGVLKEEKAFKTQYQNVIGIMMDYEIEPGEELQYDKNDKVTITYHYTNGETEKVEFYRLNEFYYVTQWGESWMACNAQQFDTMWKGFEELAQE